MITLPVPSRWGISANVGGRPLVWGTMQIDSIFNNRIMGSINFRNVPIPIQGFWNEQSKQISFESPYSQYSGTMFIYDDASISVRHYLFNGRLVMKPNSMQAGEYGTWVASSNFVVNNMTGGTQNQNPVPPVGAFITSDYLDAPVDR